MGLSGGQSEGILTPGGRGLLGAATVVLGAGGGAVVAGVGGTEGGTGTTAGGDEGVAVVVGLLPPELGFVGVTVAGGAGT